jgi:hypothetical protein
MNVIQSYFILLPGRRIQDPKVHFCALALCKIGRYSGRTCHTYDNVAAGMLILLAHYSTFRTLLNLKVIVLRYLDSIPLKMNTLFCGYSRMLSPNQNDVVVELTIFNCHTRIFYCYCRNLPKKGPDFC